MVIIYKRSKRRGLRDPAGGPAETSPAAKRRPPLLYQPNMSLITKLEASQAPLQGPEGASTTTQTPEREELPLDGTLHLTLRVEDL